MTSERAGVVHEGSWGSVVTAYQTQVGYREVVRGVPHGSLRNVVAGYVGYRTFSPEPVLRRLFPRGLVTVLFDVESPRRWVLGGQHLLSSLAVPVIGLRDRVVHFSQSGWHSGVAAGLTPVTAFALLDVEMFEFATGRADLVDLLGSSVRELVERLTEAVDWPSQFAIVDEFLLHALRARPAGDDLAAYAWRRLQRADGAMSVTALADELGVTARTLELRFRREVGVAPKTAARILRFQHAVHLFERGHRGGMTAIAHECGYTDHAHFAHEVRAMTGCTPTQLRATLRPALPNTPARPPANRAPAPNRPTAPRDDHEAT